MKPTINKPATLLMGVTIIGASIIFVSSGFKQKPLEDRSKSYIADTIPQKGKSRDLKVRDLDEAIDNLDNVNIDVEVDKAMAEATKAMKEVDFSKIKVDLDKAMKDVDMSKIKLDMEKAMKDIDWNKIKIDIDQSMAKVDWDKIKLDIDKVKEINFDKLKIEIDDLKIDLEKMGPEIRKSMDAAKVEIEKAKVELKEYKTLIDDLDKQGLINKKEGYKIDHKDGKLLINGKDAPAGVYEKHKAFLKKHETFSINQDEDNFNIDLD